jgi:hypothetical protein
VKLLEFVRALPDGYAYAPIYQKGAELPDGGTSKGKTPLGRAHHQIMGAADVALQIERAPDVFKAVGVFTGPRSRGLVILDVDANLSKLRKKWGETIEGAPCVTSTKANAAKFLFYVPEALWSQVKGVSLTGSGAGYEVLWGRQGLLYGAYPGSSDGKAPEGQYGLVGDLEAIPEAPAWLVAEMRDAASQSEPVTGKFLKNRKALDFSDRTQDEIAEIAQDCLRVIPHLGMGSRDQWIQVGMALHDALPNDLGLTLWSAWSAEDPEYAQEWEGGNPCEKPWGGFKPGGGIRFNSLIWMADQQDPQRRRFSDASRVAVEDAETRQVQEVRSSALPFEEAMKRVEEAMELPNPGRRNYELNQIAMASGYRDQAKLEQIYVDHVGYQENPGELTLDRLGEYAVKREYLIPDVLPTPAVVIFYGAGGDGKSMGAWTLARHIVEGIPFVVRGRPVPVTQGNVVILNGDQPIADLMEQLEEADYPLDDRTTLRSEWSLQYYAQFVDLMKKRRPALVIIDSLIGCSGGKAFDENKSEFAMPLYWLTRNNGVLWPATSIVIIHHANKTGGFRGTSAIRDAVSETWKLSKPEPGKSSLQSHQRLITIEKSRCGRGGTHLLMQMENDLSFSICDYVPEREEEDSSPANITGKVLARVRTGYPRWYSRADLQADPLVGGSVAAVRKALQRLVKRGLIRSEARASGGSPFSVYQAVLSLSSSSNSLSRPRGEGALSVSGGQIPSSGGGLGWDTSVKNEKVSHPKSGRGSDFEAAPEGGGHFSSSEGVCPTPEPSGVAGSAQYGTDLKYPRARNSIDPVGDAAQAWSE